MRILIIGGTRFMGRASMLRLHEMGHEIVLFHRGNSPVELPKGVAEIPGNRQQLEDFREAFKRFAPNVVLDMLCMTEADAQADMQMFKGLAQRIVVASSQDVYRAFGRINGIESGPPEPGPITEDSPLRTKLYPYRGEEFKHLRAPDYDKILVERVIMGDPELPGTVLRLPAVYGPNDYQHRFFTYIKRMDDKRPAILLDEREARWRWSHAYVENVAAAIALVVTDERARGRIYNVSELETPTLAERVQRIADVAGWHGEIVQVPAGRLPEPLSMGLKSEQDIVVDSTRIRQELGYSEPVSQEEALKRTVAWERANPPAQIEPRQFDYAFEDTILAELGR